MAQSGQRKCLCCGLFFDSDHRNRRQQRYCSAGACRRASKGRRASKAASQALWLTHPDNAGYFRDPVHVARVQTWRAWLATIRLAGVRVASRRNVTRRLVVVPGFLSLTRQWSKAVGMWAKGGGGGQRIDVRNGVAMAEGQRSRSVIGGRHTFADGPFHAGRLGRGHSCTSADCRRPGPVRPRPCPSCIRSIVARSRRRRRSRWRRR